LIAKGVKSILIFSDEAPNGYMKDGTPMSKRGRKQKPESSKKKAKKPLIRTVSAPDGLKLNGMPGKKRGRKSKAEKLAQEALAKQQAETVKVSVEQKMEIEENLPLKPIETIPETEQEQIANAIKKPGRKLAILLPRSSSTNGPIVTDANVRLIEGVCINEYSRNQKGKVGKVYNNFANVHWDDGSTDQRHLKVLETFER
jgi:hypothetical protein